jgi:uncharacterized protein (DUF433 family)
MRTVSVENILEAMRQQGLREEEISDFLYSLTNLDLDILLGVQKDGDKDEWWEDM